MRNVAALAVGILFVPIYTSAQVLLAEANPDPSSRPYFLKKETSGQACANPKLLDCLEITEAQCKTAVEESVVGANATAAKDDPGGELSPNDQAWLEGMAYGAFMAEMQKRTDRKFMACIRQS